jgi:ABC-type polysaccharide transport system permease subunit
MNGAVNMSQMLSIMNPELQNLDRQIAKEIIRRNNLSDDFAIHFKKLVNRNRKAFIAQSVAESILISVVFIMPAWVALYVLLPELFQSQTNIFIKALGFLPLIWLSSWVALSVINARMPMIESGSFEEELQAAEKDLKPMIERFKK